MDHIHALLFQLYPYLAGAIFILGSILRFDAAPYTWKTNSSQLFHSGPVFRIGSILFHVGILALFFGHLVGFLMPHSWYPVFGLTAGSKQVLAMVAGGIAGVICLVGATILVHRRLFNERIRAHNSQGDTFILLLVYAQLITGLVTIFLSVHHLDGGMMLTLTTWAQDIVTFHGSAAQILVDVPFLYKLHIFLGITIFLVFPFTRLVHIWSAPVWYLGRAYQIVRQRATARAVA
jgi:nitrate reductase gamma subunit